MILIIIITRHNFLGRFLGIAETKTYKSAAILIHFLSTLVMKFARLSFQYTKNRLSNVEVCETESLKKIWFRRIRSKSVEVPGYCVISETFIFGLQGQSAHTYRSWFNPSTPNDLYMSRTAPLTSKRYILYIYSTNTGTEYFKHALYSPCFSLQNAVCFIMLTSLVPVLFTFYTQSVLKLKKKNNSGAKGLKTVYKHFL